MQDRQAMCARVYRAYAPYETGGRVMEALAALARTIDAGEDSSGDERDINVLEISDRLQKRLLKAGLNTVEEIARYMADGGNLYSINGIGVIGGHRIARAIERYYENRLEQEATD